MGKVTDSRGRVWVNRRGKLVLDEEDHPKLHACRVHHTSYVMTTDGRIYDYPAKKFLDIPYAIKQLISTDHGLIALTTEGKLLSVGTTRWKEGVNISGIADNVAHLLGVFSYGSTHNILIVNSDGKLKDIIYRDILLTEVDRTPEGLDIEVGEIINVKDNYAITSDGYLQFYPLNNGWEIKIVAIPKVLDIARISQYIDGEMHNYDMIITTDGELLSYYYNSNKISHCENRDLNEHGSTNRWVRLVSLFKYDEYAIGLINEIGEIYAVNHRFMYSPTDLPTEIYAPPSTRVKNARNLHSGKSSESDIKQSERGDPRE